MYRLQSACASIRAKEALIQKLERERDEMRMSLDVLDNRNRNKENAEVFAEQRGKLMDKISALEGSNKVLKAEVEVLRAKQESMSALNTPRFNEMAEQTLKVSICAYTATSTRSDQVILGFSVCRGGFRGFS